MDVRRSLSSTLCHKRATEEIVRTDFLESNAISLVIFFFFFTVFVWWFFFLGSLHLYYLHAALRGWRYTELEVEPHMMDEGPGVS